MTYQMQLLETKLEGREEERLNSIRSLMENLKLTAEKAMQVLNIPAAEHDKYLALL